MRLLGNKANSSLLLIIQSVVMKQNSFRMIRVIVSVVMFIISSLTMNAQTSGDKLYNQGLEFQKTMTVKAQRSAIAKFTSAKKLYDSQTKKAQCDQAIKVSNEIIKSLNPGGGAPRYKNAPETVTRQEALNITPEEFAIDCQAKTLTVTVAAINIDDWTAIPVSNSDGSSFLTVKKGNDMVTIECDRNNTTARREQQVAITGGDIKRMVRVVQAGQPVELLVSDSFLEFGNKGGKKNLDLYTNSTSEYAENNNLNWRIVSKPDWVDVVVETEQAKKKNSGGLWGKAKQIGGNLISSISEDKSSGMKVTNTLVVNVDKIAKGTHEYNSGRKGEIVLAADEQTVSVLIVQK